MTELAILALLFWAQMMPYPTYGPFTDCAVSERMAYCHDRDGNLVAHRWSDNPMALTKDEWFDVYLLKHPDADRVEFDREWDAVQKAKAEHEAKMTVQ